MTYDTATPYIASYVLIKKEGKYAFVLRTNTSWMNGYYGLPSGKVENNESFSAAAIREAKEEVGATISPKELKFVHSSHRKSAEGLYWVDVIFEATKWEGELINAEPDLHSELAWFDPKTLPLNTIPSVRFVIEEITKGNSYSEYGWDTT